MPAGTRLKGLRPTRVNLTGISSGARGTRQTLIAMAGFVRSDMGRCSPVIRALAVRLTNHCPQKDRLCEVVSIHRFVRDRIRYVRDINGVETLHTPEKVLEYGAGDCDDKAVLASALLEAVGFKTRLTAVGQYPGFFTHVLIEVYLMGKWVPVETTEPVKVGWRPKKLPYKMVQKI